uniref:T9SS type A sorting domain-containing protein n=1 Tax=Flavobacterium sp. TaxID=239 RepID=UPI00404A233C
APYLYSWNTGETTENITVCPEETTNYTITITDAKGCSTQATIQVNVVDVTCGKNNKSSKVQICHKGQSICVSSNAVQSHLNHGDTLGSCDDEDVEDEITYKVYPNTFVSYVIVDVNTTKRAKAEYVVYNFNGRTVYKSKDYLNTGNNKSVLTLWYLPRGFYYLKIIVDGKVQGTQQLIKK